MGVRCFIIVDRPAFGNEWAYAEGLPHGSELPPVVVSQTSGIKQGRTENAPAARRKLPIPVVYVTTPLAGPSTDVDKFPASVNAVDSGQIERAGSLNVADALQKYVPGVVVSEVSGNPFQPDVQFRSFVASPVSGTPQGLAVCKTGCASTKVRRHGELT